MIPVFKPSLGKEELDELHKIFKTGWIGLGPKTKEFEENFSSYVGVKHAVALNSCTAALHLALKVMEVEGGEVITTPMTFVSTNHAILYNHATPIFADIEEDTLNIDVSCIKEKITEKTKAIVVMHYGGHACDMDPILELAKKHDLRVIEDAAHACGGEYLTKIGNNSKWRKLGSIGDIGCFSFQAVKNLATGDGGMITTNNDKINERLRKLRWLGITKGTWDRTSEGKGYSWYYGVDEIGFMYHMNDIAAAIGLVQLKKLDMMNEKRQDLCKKYNQVFSSDDWIELPVEKDYTHSACHNYVIKVDQRDELISYLYSCGISAGMHYIPNHLYKIYAPYRTTLPVVEHVWKRLVTLPLYYDLSKEDQQRVVKAVKNFRKSISKK